MPAALGCCTASYYLMVLLLRIVSKKISPAIESTATQHRAHHAPAPTQLAS
jgi:hypothetical protein